MPPAKTTLAAVIAGLLVAAPLVYGEPQLPAGLGSEPALPAGIGAEPAMPAGLDGSAADDDWDFSDEDNSQAAKSNLAGITGFWELRLGQRLRSAPNQRQASLAETRLELKKDWQWQQGTTAKVTADLRYDDIEDSHHNDLESGDGWLDLREAWVQHRFAGNVDVKAGRQILTWGVGDLVFINDLFPKDWNSFLAGRDEQYLKAPSDALRLGAYSDVVNVNVIYSPRFDADRTIDGRRLSYFSPLAGEVVGQNQVLLADQPDDTGEDDEWALRLYRPLGSYEVALYGYQGFWKSPGGFNPHTGQAIFPRLQVLGTSARGPMGPGIASAEMGYYRSKDDGNGRDPFVNNDEFRALAAYEWEAAQDTTLGAQYYLEAMQDYGAYRQGLQPGQNGKDHYRQLVTLRVTRLAMNQNLTLGLFVFYSPTDADTYVRPKVQYKINDNWQVEGGMNLFAGKNDYSFFGQFEDNTNAYASVRYSF